MEDALTFGRKIDAGYIVETEHSDICIILGYSDLLCQLGKDRVAGVLECFDKSFLTMVKSCSLLHPAGDRMLFGKF